MEYLGKKTIPAAERPVKVLQFGEGNFLRAFADEMIDIANEKGTFDGDIVIVKPTDRGNLDRFKKQDCRYTVELRGIVGEEAVKTRRVITSVADAVSPYTEYEKYDNLAKLDSLRFVISNTTEAGIVYVPEDRSSDCPPQSFPGKLTKFLYTRFEYFNGAKDKGLVMLPVELIDDNGIHLKECVLKQIENWGLSDSFKTWVEEACIFASTLVDRIVTGFPKDEIDEICNELGYRDDLLVTGEPFGLWVIESRKDISKEFALDRAGLPVIFTDDHHPYKTRKVRILNGAHTSFVLASYLKGNDIVLESMNDPVIYEYVKRTLYDEVIPTLTLPKAELEEFAEAVFKRFRNPYVKHQHLSIALNSVSKWKARCLPTYVDYVKATGKVPSHLAFSMAALMAFYTSDTLEEGALLGHRGEETYKICDDLKVLEFFKEFSGKRTTEYVQRVLSNTDFWGMDITTLSESEKIIASYLEDIRKLGMKEAILQNFSH